MNNKLMAINFNRFHCLLYGFSYNNFSRIPRICDKRWKFTKRINRFLLSTSLVVVLSCWLPCIRSTIKGGFSLMKNLKEIPIFSFKNKNKQNIIFTSQLYNVFLVSLKYANVNFLIKFIGHFNLHRSRNFYFFYFQRKRGRKINY